MLEPGSLTCKETIHRGADPDSGARIKQLTSTPAIHTNVYFEVPYADAGSRWICFTRQTSSHAPAEVWRADLERDWLTPVCDQVAGISGTAVAPDQSLFVCIRRRDDGEQEVVRTDIATLEQRATPLAGAPKVRTLGSLGPDHRTYIYATALSPHRYGVVCADLDTAQWRVIHEGHDICNAHPQLEPGHGRDVMIQHNRGCEIDDEGRVLRLVGDEGATLYLVDTDGGNLRTLPVGQPFTWRCQGHQCWIGDTCEILLTVSGGPADEMRERGNLLALRPGDEVARVVATGHLFWHANASRDGRFFVSDTIGAGPLLVGSLRTGRTRLLCDPKSSCSTPQYTHPHPYFTPDCRWVIFNSDVTGIPHVYAARVPDGLLEELEG